MDSAHLTDAHEHARNATIATYHSNFDTAIVEHELAASAFRDATKETENSEALRILGLLETHHHRLATIIKAPKKGEAENGDKDTTGPSVSQTPQSAQTPGTKVSSRTASPSPSTSPPARVGYRRRLPRDYNSSIANNLATARGIPSPRGASTSAPVSVTAALASRADRPTRGEQASTLRDTLQRQSRRPDDVRSKDQSSQPNRRQDQRQDGQPTRAASTSSDEGFRQFYSKIMGTVLSNIPAPLAFTSFPLSSSSEPPASQPAKPPSLESSRVTSRPDDIINLSTLISKPALRALKDDQGPSGPFANHESFYIVPTTGGTVSYAGILTHPPSHPHHAAQNPHLPDVAEEDGASLHTSSHEEFVDALDTPYPPSPTLPRHTRKSSASKPAVTSSRDIAAGRGRGLKTLEEIQLENETLKGLVDRQSKRLQMWEATSQSSYSVLAQSMRARGGLRQQGSDPGALAHALGMGANANTGPSGLASPPPVPSIPEQFKKPLSTAAEKTAEEAEMERRIKELESLLQEQSLKTQELEKDRERLEKDNERNAKVLGKYREQWERLKAGARKKERERAAGSAATLTTLARAREEERGRDAGEGAGEKGEGDETVTGTGDRGEDDGVQEPGFGKA